MEGRVLCCGGGAWVEQSLRRRHRDHGAPGLVAAGGRSRRRGVSACAGARGAQGAGRGAQRVVELYDAGLGRPVPYEPAWAWQKALVDARLENGVEAGRDALLVVQHEPVFTLGTGSTDAHLRFEPDAPPPGFGLHRTERGGEATYHGPGQLVLYPLLDLRANHTPDLHWYMRALEEVAMRAIAGFGLEGHRVEGLTGAWCNGHKVAALGVRARRWVTYHGVALNVCPELGHFGHIVPCGISDRPVGSVRGLLSDGLGDPAAARLSDDELLRRAHAELLDAFAAVFDVELEPASLDAAPAEVRAATAAPASAPLP